MKTNSQLRAIANTHLHLIDDAGFTPYLIGGLLRAEHFGTTTSDVDIAILVSPEDFEGAKMDIKAYLPDYVLQHECDSPYAHTSGFLADYRCGDVNLIIYNKRCFNSIDRLVQSFDLNINKFYELDGKVYNTEFNGTDVEYSQHHLHLPRPERIERFRTELPHLNWERVHV